MPTSSYRFAILLALVVSPMPFAAAQPPPLTRPHLMVVGTAHFANRNLDLADINVDDVLSPDRQKQMEDLVSALARYRPTRIAVEITPDKQAELNARYLDYRAGKYTLKRDEVDQIAFRLAAKLNLPQVDAVNDFDPPPGPQEAYDVASFAETKGQKTRWDVYAAHAQQLAAEDTAYLRSHSLSEWFLHANEPASLAALNLPYYEKATFGDWKQHPGANWVGGWYARNLTIFPTFAASRRRTTVFWSCLATATHISSTSLQPSQVHLYLSGQANTCAEVRFDRRSSLPAILSVISLQL